MAFINLGSCLLLNNCWKDILMWIYSEFGCTYHTVYFRRGLRQDPPMTFRHPQLATWQSIVQISRLNEDDFSPCWVYWAPLRNHCYHRWYTHLYSKHCNFPMLATCFYNLEQTYNTGVKYYFEYYCQTLAIFTHTTAKPVENRCAL